MKLYDFDGMFDKKLSAYISANAGKYSEEEWEDMIPALYSEFGNAVIKSLGVSPNEYYGAMSPEELVKTLKAHIKNGVPVPQFLCMAIESRPECKDMLLSALKEGEESLKRYVVNILGPDPEAAPQYMRLITDGIDGEDLKNLCIDFIKENADIVLEQAIKNYNAGIEKDLMLEILSGIKMRDDRVYDMLITRFRNRDSVLPYASYLALYGDERALPYLMERIEEDDISYVEYRELKYAIEALGGEYSGERDFTGDKDYKLIHSHKTLSDSIFDLVGKAAANGENGENNSPAKK